MSMSTLGAQLAALQNLNNGNQALPTSRRHEDAIGRGVAHSVQLGYANYDKAHTYKVSIIYKDAKQASNVPLTTIQENCVSSLRELEEVDPAFGDFVTSLCQNDGMERGLKTRQENDQIDSTIQDLLYRLALRMISSGGTKKRMTSIGLHILEFLLRRYDLHIRPKLVQTTLLVLLPHHEHAYFLRFLQLVDLASLPSYSWLRPFAIPNARVGRTEISKQVSKNVALFRDMLGLVTRAATLPQHDETLSFSAAVLVEAMTLQHRRTGSLDERTVHALLPTIALACRQTKKEHAYSFCNLGYILASALVETCVLAQDPRNLLVSSILQGLAPLMAESNSPSVYQSNMETINNGLVVALTLLQQSANGADITMYQLVVANSKEDFSPKFFQSDSSYGYAMDKAVLQALVKMNQSGASLPEIFGRLFVDEGIMDFAHWIASIWVVGWRRLEKNSNKSNKKSKEHSKNIKLRQLLQGLLEESKLSHTLWKADWIEALTCFVLVNSSIPTENRESSLSTESSFLDRILTILQQKNALAYDRGVTKAFLKLKKNERSRLALWLGLTAGSGKNNSFRGSPPGGNVIVQLPARVALEHADVEIRLEAIDRVILEEKIAGVDDAMDIDGAETVFDALLRRVVIDDDVQVACKAASALSKLKHTANKSMYPKNLAMDLLQAMQKWKDGFNGDNAEKSELLIHLHKLISRAALAEEDGSDLRLLLVEAMGTNLLDSTEAVSEAAAVGIIDVLGGKKGKMPRKEARQLLLSKKECIGAFSRSMPSSSSELERGLRRQFLSMMLSTCSEAFTPSGGEDSGIVLAVLAYCLWALEVFAETLSKDEIQLLSQTLGTTSEVLSRFPQQVVPVFESLANAQSNIFDTAGLPYILEVCKHIDARNVEDMTGIVLLMNSIMLSSSDDVMERLLHATKQFVASDPRNSHLGLIPTLSLITHTNGAVRKKAIDIAVAIGQEIKDSSSSQWEPLSSLGTFLSKNRASALMGGNLFLSACLRAVARDAKTNGGFQKTLLTLCTYSAKNSGLSNVESTSASQGASAIVLKACEEAGEGVFPLILRWEVAGKTILDDVLASECESEIRPGQESLLEHLVLMLKGIKDLGPDSADAVSGNVIVHSGPAARGGRKRSYSFGKNDNPPYISPYPKDMLASIVTILSAESSGTKIRTLRNLLSRKVLQSQSWGKHVFEKCSNANRHKIASSLLMVTAKDLSDCSDEGLFAIPLSNHDIAQLVQNNLNSEVFLSSITYVADYISSNAKTLSMEASVVEVIVKMFGEFTSLSLSSRDVDESVEFARQSILDALVELFGALPLERKEDLALNKKKKFSVWINALVGTLGSETQTEYRPVASVRGKKAILSILTFLSALYPSLLAEKLILAVVSMVSGVRSSKETVVVTQCLGYVVPVYFENTKNAEQSTSALMNAFIAASNNGKDVDTKMQLYQGFADALSKTSHLHRHKYLGAFIANCFSSGIYYATEGQEQISAPSIASHALGQVAVSVRVHAILTLVTYARNIVLKLDGETLDEESSALSVNNLVAVAHSGPGSKTQKKNISNSETIMKKLCSELVTAVNETVTSMSFCRLLRHAKVDTSAPILQLWQDLLLVQSVKNTRLNAPDCEDHSFWSSIGEVTSVTLDSIQRHLPAHIFLAFVTSLIKESDSEELRARALQLVADRSLELEASDPEAGLFRDMLSFLNSLLHEEVKKSSTAVLHQSILVAIEHIARNLCFQKGDVSPKYLDVIVSALGKIATLVESQTKIGFNRIDTATKQLLCTATLCAATSVRVCGPRALPILPKLLRPSLQLLGEVNETVGANTELDGIDENQLKMLQLSFLRMTTSVAETMPQFIAPYLRNLFAPKVLPSESLNIEVDEQSLDIKAAKDRLCQILATLVPVRQLLPSLTASLSSLDETGSIICISSILTSSIKSSKGMELGGQVDNIFRAGTTIFEYAGQHKESRSLLNASNEMFLALIFKLSEVQLRSLFTKLRTWRGDFDKSNPSSSAFKRTCFWRLSVSLSTELKAIFLPCLTMVFSDAIDELDTAVESLCKRSGLKKAGGKKKQRIESASGVDYGDDELLSLQALLKCLETTLRADAHGGGGWVRDDESQRFDLLLGPLGKLLHGRLPSTSSAVTYQSLVEGAGVGTGSVVDCIAALASAAGDEQMWKPLNHSVLKSCSHETRSEVRKAGITCLSSLIRSIGEEYMVLIPECLPVLSEMLEDSDEEIAGLAQECISMSEELLGESLEESLR